MMKNEILSKKNTFSKGTEHFRTRSVPSPTFFLGKKTFFFARIPKRQFWGGYRPDKIPVKRKNTPQPPVIIEKLDLARVGNL